MEIIDSDQLIEHRNRRKLIISFCFGFLSLLLSVIVVGFNSQVSAVVKLIFHITASVFILVYIIIRAFQGRRIPTTKLDPYLSVIFLSILVSLVLSPEFRTSIERVITIIVYFLIFFLLLDMLDTIIDPTVFLWGCLSVTGLFLFQALAETYRVYLIWFDFIGSMNFWPPYVYRFYSALLWSNHMMIVANQLVFFALWQFIDAKKKSKKVAAAFYIFVYALCLPLSSSRNAVLNLAAGGLVFLLLNLHRFHLREKYQTLSKRSKIIFYSAAIIILLIGFVGGIYYYQLISSHPTHGEGGGPFSNRTGIWTNALVSWPTSPWFGIGPGRVHFGYMEGMSFPPGWLAPNAHSAIISTLVEYGVLGLAAVMIFAMVLVIQVIHAYRKIPQEKKGIASAVVAGLTAYYFHNLLDDTFIIPRTMTLLFMFLVAWILIEGKLVSSGKRFSIVVLIVPLIVAAGFNFWSNWAYIPASKVVNLPREGNWTEIAMGFSESHQRDPDHYYYVSQGGYAWAEAYQETGDGKARNMAIDYFEKSIVLEPAVSLNYANLAVLTFPDDPQQAISLMNGAIERAPLEVSYPINQGNFYEQMNDNVNAVAFYSEALEINSQLRNHPFWSETEFRSKFIGEWLEGYEEVPQDLYYWQKAQLVIDEEDFDSARFYIASAEWVGENPIKIAMVKNQYYLVVGDDIAAEDALQEMNQIITRPVIKPNGCVTMAVATFGKRYGLGIDVVPGYIILYEGVE